MARVTDSTVRELVTFRLNGELFGLPLASVTEVMRMVAVTPVPDSPSWLSGVINVRGSVVPVVDLRGRLGLPLQTARLGSRIIVVDAGGHAVGLIADSTSEVLSVPAQCVTLPDQLTSQARPVEAIARDDDRLVPILDLRRVVLGLERFGDAPIPSEEHDDRLAAQAALL